MSYKKDNYKKSFDQLSDVFHLPLDWNEELSLEEYLESLGKGEL